jgi:hypothetical protein
MTHSALVKWVPIAERFNHRMLPVRSRWIGLSRFEDDGPAWPDGAWSVEVTFDEPPAEACERPMPARIRFWFDEAPQERIRPGVQFEIYEGLHKLADVDVLD